MSFRLKTILGVALIEGCLLLLLVWSSISYLQDSSSRETAIRAETTASLFVELVRDAVLSSDLARLNSLAQQALSAPDMAYVRIMDTEQVLVEAGTRPTGFESGVISERADSPSLFAIGTDIMIEGSSYGRVELGMHTGRTDTLIADARRYLLSLAAAEMGLVALFSLILGSYLTRGLGHLTRAAERISENRTPDPVPVQGHDELAMTGRAFNIMAERLTQSRRHMQQTLQESQTLARRLAEKEQRLAAILNAAASGILTLDREGRIETINPAGAALFGYSPDELTGVPVSRLLPELPEAGELLTARGLHRSGEPLPLELSLSSLILAGEPVRLCLLRDIRERLNMEQESRRHAAISAALVEANMDAVVIIDLNDCIIEFSTMAERLFGYPRTQAIGRNMAELLIPPEMRRQHRQGMHHFSLSGHGDILGKHIEVEAMRADGTRFPAELTVQTIRLDGAVLFAGFMRDISERKAAEQSLMDARRRAEAASEAKSRFLAHMSHEIRSPLNAVLGSVSLLLDDELTREQRLYAQTADSSGKALLGLINNILDFSRIEAGQLQLHRQPFQLEQLLSDIAAHIALKAREKGLQTALVADPTLPRELLGDATRLRQILINLLDNALKFTEQGAVTLQVTADSADHHPLQLCFTVQDSGIGIPPEEQEILFEEFHQVDNSDSTRHGGSGLGLSISLGLCQAMGGTLTLDSAPGKGSRFTATLPFEPHHHAAAKPSAHGSMTLVCAGVHPLMRAAIALACPQQSCRLLHWQPGTLPALPAERRTVLLLGNTLTEPERQTLLDTAHRQHMEQLITLGLGPDDTGAGGIVNDCLPMPLLAASLNALLSGHHRSHDRQHSASAASRALTAPAAQRGHLLLAEDSPANQLVARAILERAGFTVDIADNGHDAVSACARRSYDAILMDLRMPEMDGLEATRQLRARYPGRHTPILAMTANVSQQDIERCLAAGMDDFIPKPINTAQLLTALARHLPAAQNGEHQEQGETSARDACSPLSTEDATASPLLDDTVVRSLLTTMTAERLATTITLFMDENRQRLTRLQQAINQNQMEPATLEAHTIKGCAGTFGALRLQEWAREMEAACRRQDQGTMARLISVSEHLHQQTEHYFYNKIKELTGEQDDTTSTQGTSPAGPYPAG